MTLTRRDFLKVAGLAAGDLALELSPWGGLVRNLTACTPFPAGEPGAPKTVIDPGLLVPYTHYGIYTEGKDKINVIVPIDGTVKLDFYDTSGNLSNSIQGAVLKGENIATVPSNLGPSTVFVTGTNDISSVIIEGEGSIPHKYVAAPDMRLARITETWRNQHSVPVLYDEPNGSPISTMGTEVPVYIAPALNNYVGPIFADTKQQLWAPIYQKISRPTEDGKFVSINQMVWLKLSDYSRASYNITLERGMPATEFFDFSQQKSVEQLISEENGGEGLKILLGTASMFGDAWPAGPYSMGDFAERDKLQIEIPPGVPFYPSPFDENDPYTYSTNVGVHVTAIIVDFEAYARGEIKVAALTNLTHIGGQPMLTDEGGGLMLYDVRYWDHTEYHPWLKTKDLKWDLWPAAIPAAINEIQKRKNEFRARQEKLVPVFATAAGLTILAIAAAPLIAPYLTISALAEAGTATAGYLTVMKLAPVP